MLDLLFALAVLAVVGHMAFWVGLGNRWHSTGFPRTFIKWTTRLLYVILAAPFAVALAAIVRAWPPSSEISDWRPQGFWAYYAAFCAAYGGMRILIWAAHRWQQRRPPSGVRAVDLQVVDMQRLLGGSPARGLRTQLLSRLPLNQLWQLHVGEYSLEIPGLPSDLEGLSICHLSDLHFCGRIDRGYFDEVVRLTNHMQPDLIALTGDICDMARYIDLISDTLAPTQARLGKYFVLGNHDLRTRDLGRLCRAMGLAGFTDVGKRHETICDGRVLIAGNQRPWIKPAPGTEMPPEPRREALKILLSHSPDQLPWARQRGFDLLLAGHTHGGQICFPILGPVVCPSRYGTRYASGFFHEQPTLMHVTRGTASLMPVRLGCPPEMTKLVLTAKATTATL